MLTSFFNKKEKSFTLYEEDIYFKKKTILSFKNISLEGYEESLASSNKNLTQIFENKCNFINTFGKYFEFKCDIDYDVKQGAFFKNIRSFKNQSSYLLDSLYGFLDRFDNSFDFLYSHIKRICNAKELKDEKLKVLSFTNEISDYNIGCLIKLSFVFNTKNKFEKAILEIYDPSVGENLFFTISSPNELISLRKNLKNCISYIVYNDLNHSYHYKIERKNVSTIFIKDKSTLLVKNGKRSKDFFVIGEAVKISFYKNDTILKHQVVVIKNLNKKKGFITILYGDNSFANPKTIKTLLIKDIVKIESLDDKLICSDINNISIAFIKKYINNSKYISNIFKLYPTKYLLQIYGNSIFNKFNSTLLFLEGDKDENIIKIIEDIKKRAPI